MIDIATAIVFTKALVLLLGVGLTYLAYRAYQRTAANSLGSLALGLALITVGSLLGGGFDRLVGIDTEVGVLANSILTGVGFLIILRSLYVPESHRRVGVEKSGSDR